MGDQIAISDVGFGRGTEAGINWGVAPLPTGPNAKGPGTLLITEAGGRVGTLTGEDYKQGGHIVGGTPKVFAALVAAIQPHVTDAIR